MPNTTKQPAPLATKRQARRKDVVGGSVTREEKAEIERALRGAGYETTSEGVREIMLSWSRGKLAARAA